MKKYFSLVIPEKRIWELDFLKGLAFILMVWDHVVFDLNDFFGIDTSVLGFFEEGIGHISAAMFMLVCGISVTLGNHNIKHGLQVFGLGMALTLATFIVGKVMDMDLIICFGILHFLGLSMIIGHFTKKLPVFVLLIFAIISVGLGIWFNNLIVETGLLFPFGLCSKNFFSSDYFPLFPNLSYTFIGLIVGKIFYKNKISLFKFRPQKSLFCNFGRHTLSLYFIHQPIVVGILFFLNIIFKFN